MTPPLVPHISLPFRFNPDGTVPIVEQGSDEEIWDCIRTIVRCPLGFRLEDPEFGIEQLEFQEQPVDTSQIEEAVLDCEDRALTVIAEEPDEFEDLIDRVVINVIQDNG